SKRRASLVQAPLPEGDDPVTEQAAGAGDDLLGARCWARARRGARVARRPSSRGVPRRDVVGGGRGQGRRCPPQATDRQAEGETTLHGRGDHSRSNQVSGRAPGEVRGGADALSARVTSAGALSAGGGVAGLFAVVGGAVAGGAVVGGTVAGFVAELAAVAGGVAGLFAAAGVTVGSVAAGFAMLGATSSGEAARVSSPERLGGARRGAGDGCFAGSGG